MVGFRGGLIESSEAATIKKYVLKNFAELTGKHLCQSLFFDKVSFYISVRVSFLIKLQAEALEHVLSRQFCEFFKNTSFYRAPPVTASV